MPFDPQYLLASYAGGLAGTVAITNMIYMASGWPQKYVGIVVSLALQALAFWALLPHTPEMVGVSIANAAVIYLAAVGTQWEIAQPQPEREVRGLDIQKRRFTDMWM